MLFPREREKKGVSFAEEDLTEVHLFVIIIFSRSCKNAMLCIARIFYPVTVLGPGNRVGIWVAGCNKNCKGCISPELRDTKNGKWMSSEQIISIVKSIQDPIDGITISGGEPFLNPKGLLEFILLVEKLTNDIIVFTGFKYNELLSDTNSKRVLNHISVLIDGEYDINTKTNNGLRGSSNQQIIVFKNHEKYFGIESCDREIQSIVFGGKLLSIGIPKG